MPSLPDETAVPVGDPSAPDPLLGALLHGKYRLVRLIGTGGFGTVYEASDERGAGNRVAVKILKKEFSADARLVRAFRAEARRMTRLSHPNIVDWKNFDQAEDGTCYFVMELVQGEELDRVLERKRPLPPDRAANIILQILDALRAAHKLAEGGSVLHLDLKPRNVFVLPQRANRPEQVKVIDFGIGQHIGEDAEDVPDLPGAPNKLETSAVPDFNPTTLRFHESTVIDPPGLKRCQGCTPEYVSPEQAAHVLGMADVVPLDGRSDIYSLGVMAYQMLTGDLPFARPVMRTDYLRLHISGQPRKISTSRAKVPRSLARFVERCLKKNREDRFEDAEKAHAAVERIVRPSIALRVGIATVVLVGAAFAFGGYLMRGGARAEVLASEDAELGPQNPLYLGPERRSAVLTLRTSGLIESGSALRLVRASDGNELSGSRLTLTDPSELRLELGEDLGEGRQVLSVRVDAEEASFAPFDIVWLGPKAWSIAGARAGSVDLVPEIPVSEASPGSTSPPQAIEPAGLVLQAALAGEGRGDVERLSAHSESGAEVDLVASGADGERRLFRAELGLLALPAGPVRVSIRARDKAGSVREVAFPLTVIAGPLQAVAELCELQGEGACQPFNLLSGRFLLAPTSKPVLRVTASRSAALDWRVRADDGEKDPPWNHAAAAEIHQIPIELPPGPAEAARTGTVEARATEGELVARAESAQPEARVVSALFLVSSELAEFDAFLQFDPKSVTRARMPLVEGQTAWVNQPKLELVIERRGRPAMSVRLSDGRSEVFSASQREIRFPLELQREGTAPLVIESYRFDTVEQALADKPDSRRSFEIGLDTVPPVLPAVAGIDGDFRELEKIPESLSPELPGNGSGSTGGAPLRVTWQIDREGREGREGREAGAVVRKGTWLAGADPVPLRLLWSGSSSLADGAFKLVLLAADDAGNSAEPIESRFRVALAGPAIDFDAPRPGTWQSETEGWLVQIRARDPNGVEGATCAIVADDGARIEVELAPGAGSAEDRELRGHATIPHDWSNRPVKLEVLARDAAGKTRSAAREGLVLPPISPPRPSAVRATGGRGAVLRFVEGNAGAQYLFGGRGDDVENADQKVAGLKAFAKGGEARSWSVLYAAGEIGDFYLDEREVTRAEFLAFVQDPKGYRDRAHWPPGADAPSEALAAAHATRLASDPDLPVSEVTWEEACAFSHWMGKRLPTWIEFEYAVRGGPSTYRPFASFTGKAPGAGQVNAKGLGSGHAWAAGSGNDLTPVSALRDLSGNVAEWTATPVLLPGDAPSGERGAYFRAKRAELLAARAPLASGGASASASGGAAEEYWIAGGSFREENYFFEAAAARSRRSKSDSVGFRCALSIDDVRAALERRELEEVR